MKCKKIIAGLFIYVGFASSVFSQTTGKIVDANQHPVEGAKLLKPYTASSPAMLRKAWKHCREPVPTEATTA